MRLVAGLRGRWPQCASVLRDPFRPMRPPAARMGRRPRKPIVGVIGEQLVGPEVAASLGRRIDDAGDMSRRTEHEGHVAAEEPDRPVSGPPRNDVVLARRHRRRRASRCCRRSTALTAHSQRPGLAQAVAEIHVAQVVKNTSARAGSASRRSSRADRRREASAPLGNCRPRSSTRARSAGGSRTRSRAHFLGRGFRRAARARERQARRARCRRRCRRDPRSRASW